MISLLTLLNNPELWKLSDFFSCEWIRKSDGVLYKTAATIPDKDIIILFPREEFERPSHSCRGTYLQLKEKFYLL